MAKRKIEDYTFAAAFITSKVKELMSMQDMIRLAGCKDLSQAETILQEFGYGEAKELKDGDIEYFIRREQNKLFNLIYNSLPDRKELALYLYPYDYHNVKVCIKSELLGITPNDTYLMSNGDIEWQRVVAMVRDRSYEFMSPIMREAIREALDLFGRSNDPQEIDIIMDKACYKEMVEAANATGEEFIMGIVKLQIDILNFKTFARLREMEKPWSFFSKVFLQGGNISEQFFLSIYDEPYGQIADQMVAYGLKDVILEGTAKLKETGSFMTLEKLLEDTVMDYNKKAKYESFGIVPIAGYWHAKEVEIDNLRVILTGLQIGQKPEQIIERLREPYV